MRKRILVVNEFSLLSTGFSNYMNEVLKRLHRLGKYEIAELATYVNPLDPRIKEIPWKVYPNEPHPEDANLLEKYKSTRENQFGKFRFDEVCLDFKPHIVISIRDYWMDSWIQESTFRPYFKWVTMPTVDGEPQKAEWIETYEKADKVLTYSLWGANLLEKQSNNKIQPAAVASPAADVELFRPADDKGKAKEDFGLMSDIFIVQTVMRNQPRKLFPELLKAFNLFLDKCREEKRYDIADKTFLYFHTGFPDLGWNIPEEIRKYKLSHKVLFTYHCDSCKATYPSFYAGEKSVCKVCKKALATPPNTSQGVSRQDLARVMQIADVYVQYATSEGWALPPNDAKACGVPCLIMDYSAMSEQTTNGGAIPIEIQNFFQEPMHQTNQLRAMPDNQDFAQKLFLLLSDNSYRNELGREARECVEQYYTWDKVAKTWDEVLESTAVDTTEETWLGPAKFIQPSTKIPANLDNADFLNFCYKEIKKQPDKINSFEYHKILQMLNNGYDLGQNPDGKTIKIPMDKQKIINMFVNQIKYHNMLEQARLNHNNPKPEIVKEVHFIEV